MIAENPSNPLNLVAGSLYQEASSYNNSSIYYGSGVSGAFTSFDGGRNWVDQTLPPYPAWSNSSSPLCGDIHLADTAIGFGPNNRVYYIDLSYPASSTGCISPGGGLELFSTVSVDGGLTWQTPVSLRGNVSLSLDKPWIAVDPSTGEAYVAYTDDGNGSQIFLQNSTDGGSTWSNPIDISKGSDSMRGVELAVDPWGGVDALWVDQSTAAVQFTRSANHGHSFSAPKTIATGISEYGNPSPDGFRAYMLPGLGVDRYSASPYPGRLFAVWQNGTGGSTGDPKVSMTYSSDNGSKWAAPITVNSDTKYEDFQPDVAVGPDGTVYVEWYAVNGTSGHYRLIGASSHNGGASFDREILVSDTDSYPNFPNLGNAWWIGDYTDVITDSSGARPLWTDARSTLEWSCSPCLWGYDYNITMYTALIVNATLTASVPVNVTVNGTVGPLGNWSLGRSNTYGDWLAGETYDITAPATVQVNGTSRYFALWFGTTNTTSATLSGTVTRSGSWHACYAGAPGGLCHDPGAPGYLNLSVTPAGSLVRLDSRNQSLTSGAGNFTLAPGNHWVNVSFPGYHPSQQQVIVGPGNVTNLVVSLVAYPGTINGIVSPSSATVVIDSQSVPVAPNGSFSRVVPIGTHAVVASEYGYATYQNSSVMISPNSTASLSINLIPEFGTIQGNVTPSNAAVTINGAAVPSPGGLFSASRAQGTYWVNATLAGYLPATSGPIHLSPLATLNVSLILRLPMGFLVGSVSPLGANVTINGKAIPVVLGNFNTTLVVGSYSVNAWAPGYIGASYPVTIAQDAATPLAIELVQSPGWIVGSVNPAYARVTVDGSAVSVGSDGTFNATVAAGPHRVGASANGFDAASKPVQVQAGVASSVNLTLVNSPTSTGTSSLYLYVGVGIVVVAAAAAAVILLRRRRGSPPPEAVEAV